MKMLFGYVFAFCVLNLALTPVSGRSRFPSQSKVKCTYGGKSYSAGDEIPIPDDVCLLCTCRAGWVKPSDSSCARIDCPFAAYEECEATYSDDKCCPTWKCPPGFTTPFNIYA